MKISKLALIVGSVLLAASTASAHIYGYGVYAPVVPAPVVALARMAATRLAAA